MFAFARKQVELRLKRVLSVCFFLCINFDKLVQLKLSIIIPTLNEVTLLGRLIDRLLTTRNHKIEVIVVDGGSEDGTLDVAKEFSVLTAQCDPSRAKQMNLGASMATGDLLYFVHADTLPPIGFADDGVSAIDEGFDAACFRSEFESTKGILKLNAFFTRFNWLVSRGGDQSLFIRRHTFEYLGRFDEAHVIMEEYPLIEHLMALQKLKVIPKPILISTRKYDDRSWLKVSRANYTAFRMYKQGADSSIIRKVYQKKLS